MWFIGCPDWIHFCSYFCKNSATSFSPTHASLQLYMAKANPSLSSPLKRQYYEFGNQHGQKSHNLGKYSEEGEADKLTPLSSTSGNFRLHSNKRQRRMILIDFSPSQQQLIFAWLFNLSGPLISNIMFVELNRGRKKWHTYAL